MKAEVIPHKSPMRNAFLLTDSRAILDRGRQSGVESFVVATTTPEIFSGDKSVTPYRVVNAPQDAEYDRLALLSLEREDVVDAVIERVLGHGATLIAAACYSLAEAGRVEARYHLSPVQLLHKLGILENQTVVGGVYLDRDDIDLMAQSGARLIICPTASLGYGYGIPPFAACHKKLAVSLGSGDNRYNPDGDMLHEARVMLLASNCDMRSPTSVAPEAVLGAISVGPGLAATFLSTNF